MNGPAQTGTIEERLSDLVDSTRWLAGHLWRSELRHASILAGIRPLEVIMSGAAALTSIGGGPVTWSRNFREEIATATIEDPNEIGPLLVVTGDGPDSAYQAPGPGRLLVPRGGSATIPMLGSTLSITAIAPPGYTGVLAGPGYAFQAPAAGTDLILVPAPALGSLRIRAAWLAPNGGNATTNITSADGSVVALQVRSATPVTSPWRAIDGPILPVGQACWINNAATGQSQGAVVYDVVSTTGPLLAYVTLRGRR